MFVRTQRLILRPGWIEDAPMLASAIGEEAIVRNLARAPWPYTLVDAERFIADRFEASLPNFLIFARTHGAPRLVGGAGFHRDAEGEAELGYWIARAHWGLGYATEAAAAAVALGETILRRPKIVAGHYLDNPASGRVLRKLGFMPTGGIAMRYSRARERHAPCAMFERWSNALPMHAAELAA